MGGTILKHRQGRTPSPFLFVLSLTAIMDDAQALVKEARPIFGGPAPGGHGHRARRRRGASAAPPHRPNC
eukprot:9648314-Alexandrium_andersonii.AAC.1